MVLTPLSKQELEEIFDVHARKVINYFLDKTILLQPEIIQSQDELPIQIPKEHIEQWFVQAINANSVGAGSYPIDILMPNRFGADVKMLSCKINKDGTLKANALSGETSLAQKFKSTGADLDTLFNTGKYQMILDGWKEILIRKIESVLEENEGLKIYYFFFLRAGRRFYLCGCKVDHNEIKNTTVIESRSNDKNVHIGNFIQDEYGKVTIYKAKKRMELRLYPRYWYDQNNVLEFVTNKNTIGINLREKAINGELEGYVRGLFEKILEDL